MLLPKTFVPGLKSLGSGDTGTKNNCCPGHFGGHLPLSCTSRTTPFFGDMTELARSFAPGLMWIKAKGEPPRYKGCYDPRHRSHGHCACAPDWTLHRRNSRATGSTAQLVVSAIRCRRTDSRRTVASVPAYREVLLQGGASFLRSMMR